MSIKLYYTLASPPARAVMIALKQLNIPHELLAVNILQGEQRSPEYLKKNPQHTVPTLDDNGFVVLDSHAINAYLVTKYGKTDKWYPRDVEARSVVDHRLHFDTGVLFPSYRYTVINFRFRKTVTGITKEIVGTIKEAYGMVEAFLKMNRFIAGNELTIADFNAFTSLTTMELFWPIDKEKYPLITAYLEECRTSMPQGAEINKAGIEAFKEVMDGFNFQQSL